MPMLVSDETKNHGDRLESSRIRFHVGGRLTRRVAMPHGGKWSDKWLFSGLQCSEEKDFGSLLAAFLGGLQLEEAQVSTGIIHPSRIVQYTTANCFEEKSYLILDFVFFNWSDVQRFSRLNLQILATHGCVWVVNLFVFYYRSSSFSW